MLKNKQQTVKVLPLPRLQRLERVTRTLGDKLHELARHDPKMLALEAIVDWKLKRDELRTGGVR